MTDGGRAPLHAACVSRTGRRPANEDSALAQVLSGPAIEAFSLVCDGMGGHNAGEVASAMASEILAGRIRAAAAREALAEPEQDLLEWIAEANRTVFARSETDVELKGMGTTAAVALVTGERRLVVANIGDSRIFLVRGPQVTQLSVDHTALAERRRVLGHDEVSPEEEVSSPFAHALTRSLGQEARVLPDSRSDVALEEGDVVVVTSDGVTDVLESERFLRAIEASPTLPDVAEEIYRLAFDGGSRDNISVALLACGKPSRLGVAVPPDGERAARSRPDAAPRPRHAFAGAVAAAAIAGVALAGFLSQARRAEPRRPEPPRRPPAPLVAPLSAPPLSAAEAPAEPPAAPTRRPRGAAPAPVALPHTAPLAESAIPPREPEEPDVTLADARLEGAWLRRIDDGWRIELRFRDPVRPAGEIAARASELRVAGRETSGSDASYPLGCVARGRALECTLAGADFTPDPPLASGDAVLVHVAGEGFAFDAQALIGE